MAEAAVILSPLGWVASPLLKMLFDKAHELLGTSLKERMEILEATVLPTLSLAIHKAEKSPNKKKVELWLERLKGAYYEAEEAIDLFEYEVLKQKVNANRKTQISLPFGRRLVLKIILKSRIDKLLEIVKEADEFRDLFEANGEPDRENIARPSGKVFGREKDKENIASWLRKKPLISEPVPSTRPAISIIAIMGRSGIGKTTLAQYIYQYMKEENTDNYFDLILWVHLPRKFMAADVVKKTLQNILAKYDTLHVDNYTPSGSLDDHASQMDRLLDSKRFLLVLDDFWCDDEDFVQQWENFVSCLSAGLPGSKILITTQSKQPTEKVSVSSITEVKNYILEDLEPDQILKIFMHEACPSDHSIQRREFEIIGSKIAEKMKGDPGEAKIVGRQLRLKPDIKAWKKIAEKDWFGSNIEARIWSYQQLPVHLQRCFAICCLLRKGDCVSSEYLIQLWMAQGYIKPVDDGKRMEDIGEDYLDELASRFFLEEMYVDFGLTYYGLHDLLHDLVERVQGDNFLRIDYPSSINVPPQTSTMLSQCESIRHLRLPVSMIIELKDKICLMKNLCTLICDESNFAIPKKVLHKIVKSLQKLRVLHLPRCCDDFPNSIGNLKHLRMLRFVGSLPLQKLPASICKLYLLQTLVFQRCESVPKKLFKLVSLRVIGTVGKTMSLIFYVGRLTSLQGLYKFVVKKERGHELHQLENLHQLRGILRITGLENVTSIKDAAKAKMSSKCHLEGLKFKWKIDERVVDERVVDDVSLLNTLEPHPKIRSLTIERFRGYTLPNWLLHPNSLQDLNTLQLIECPNIVNISSISESLPNCKFLFLSGLNSLNEFPLLPSSLTSVSLHHIPQLTYICKNDFDLLVKQEINKAMLQAIEYMKSRYDQQLSTPVNTAVRRCLQLVKERLKHMPYKGEIDPWKEDYCKNKLLDAWEMCMPYYLETMLNENIESKLVLPSSLTSLDISSCNITTGALSSCIQCLVSLSELRLSEIQTITSLPPEEVLGALKNLHSLHIKECYLLRSLGGISALASLTELTLKRCLCLNSLNEKLPSSLEKLTLEECEHADVILEQSDLPVLRVLNIFDEDLRENCRNKVICIARLPSLKELHIEGWRGGLEGLNTLTSLHWLTMLNTRIYLLPCPDKCTIQIKKVKVDNPLLLKQMLSQETISSIEYLSFALFRGDSINDEVFESLTSLKRLYFINCNITHLPVHLKNLPHLKAVALNKCPNLRDIESLPENIIQLEIIDCPSLVEKFNNGGSYWVCVEAETTTVTFPTKGEHFLIPRNKLTSICKLFIF